MISYKSFLAEWNKCVPVRACTHTCVREGHVLTMPASCCAISQSARLLSATTEHWQKRKGYYTEIAYRPSLRTGKAESTACWQPVAAQILICNSAARRIYKWELKGTGVSAAHIEEKRQLKSQTTAEKPEEEQLKDQPEKLETLSEKLTLHRVGKNSCCRENSRKYPVYLWRRRWRVYLALQPQKEPAQA